jgi:hypothetical protein
MIELCQLIREKSEIYKNCQNAILLNFSALFHQEDKYSME